MKIGKALCSGIFFVTGVTPSLVTNGRRAWSLGICCSTPKSWLVLFSDVLTPFAHSSAIVMEPYFGKPTLSSSVTVQTPVVVFLLVAAAGIGLHEWIVNQLAQTSQFQPFLCHPSERALTWRFPAITSLPARATSRSSPRFIPAYPLFEPVLWSLQFLDTCSFSKDVGAILHASPYSLLSRQYCAWPLRLLLASFLSLPLRIDGDLSL